MSGTGSGVFDKTIQTTNIWLDEIMAEIGPNRQVAWHVLSAVLRTLRDRIPLGTSAHLGAQLPVIVRGTYYDQWSPFSGPLKIQSEEEFLEYVQKQLSDIRSVNPREAVVAVFNVLSRHLPRGQCVNVRDALPDEVQALWQLDQGAVQSIEGARAAAGKSAVSLGPCRK
jgi:uncharacterized protein (DUF2267 family)